MFRNRLFFHGEGLLAQPQAEGPPLVVSPRMLIQCLRSYPPYQEPPLSQKPKGAPCCDDKGATERGSIVVEALWYKPESRELETR
jgi:hypothetical protein